MSARILLVDDDRFLLENLRILLTGHGYQVATASSAEDGYRAAAANRPDLAVLDVGLPDSDGVSLCRRMRAQWGFPILMLTARTDAMDKVVSLEVGADDYVTKPFEPIELVARIRAHLRRVMEYDNSRPRASVLSVGELTIDMDARSVSVGGRPVELTMKEFCLLAHLAANAGRVLSRDSLFEHSWGFDISFSSNSLDVHIYRLRKKLEPDPERPCYLHTVKGFGYKLEYAGTAEPSISM